MEPPPFMSPNQDDKLWAALSHALTLVAGIIPFGQIIAPLVIWLVKKDQSRFAAQHALESLNFRISMILYALVWVPFAIICFFTIILFPVAILVCVAVGVFSLVVVIVGIVKGANGESYRYPLSLRLVK
jgi:uncharacterized protein